MSDDPDAKRCPSCGGDMIPSEVDLVKYGPGKQWNCQSCGMRHYSSDGKFYRPVVIDDPFDV